MGHDCIGCFLHQLPVRWILFFSSFFSRVFKRKTIWFGWWEYEIHYVRINHSVMKLIKETRENSHVNATSVLRFYNVTSFSPTPDSISKYMCMSLDGSNVSDNKKCRMKLSALHWTSKSHIVDSKESAKKLYYFNNSNFSETLLIFFYFYQLKLCEKDWKFRKTNFEFNCEFYQNLHNIFIHLPDM